MLLLPQQVCSQGAGLTMQEAEPAGWVQMWESWTTPSPHLHLQTVPFTRLSPTWCSRFGSMAPGQETQETQKTSSTDPGLAGPWRLPLAPAAPHPVVRQDQLSFSSSSSSGTQTGEMLDPGHRQSSRQLRNPSGSF